MRVRMLWIIEFDNMKSTFISIEVNIADFKIWGVRFPNLCFRVFFLYHLPRSIADMDCQQKTKQHF